MQVRSHGVILEKLHFGDIFKQTKAGGSKLVVNRFFIFLLGGEICNGSFVSMSSQSVKFPHLFQYYL